MAIRITILGTALAAHSVLGPVGGNMIDAEHAALSTWSSRRRVHGQGEESRTSFHGNLRMPCITQQRVGTSTNAYKIPGNANAYEIRIYCCVVQNGPPSIRCCLVLYARHH